MGGGGDSANWQGQDAAAATARAQAEAVKTSTSAAKAAATGARAATGAASTPANSASGSTGQCVDPAAVKGYRLPCAQLPKAIQDLLGELMGASDLVVTYSTQLEPKRCLGCMPFARRDVLDMTFGRARADLPKGATAEAYDLRAWRYHEAADNAGRVKFGAVEPLLNVKDLPRAYGLGSLPEEGATRFPRYPLPASEQEIAKSDALSRLGAIAALPAFADVFTQLAIANPRLLQQMDNQLRAIADQVSDWRCGVNDPGSDGGWRQVYPVVECTRTPPGSLARPGEVLPKVDLEGEAGEPVREGPPSRTLPEANLSFTLSMDEAIQRALARQKKSGSCDLPPIRVEFKHAQPTEVGQSPALVAEDPLQLRDATASVRAAAVMFEQMKRPLKLIIRGYTDRSGAPRFDNDALSLLRARWLEAQIRGALGASAGRAQVQTVGCGDLFADRNQPNHRPSRVAVISYQ